MIVATHAIDCRRADHIVVAVGGPLGRSVHTGNVGRYVGAAGASVAGRETLVNTFKND